MIPGKALYSNKVIKTLMGMAERHTAAILIPFGHRLGRPGPGPSSMNNCSLSKFFRASCFSSESGAANILLSLWFTTSKNLGSLSHRPHLLLTSLEGFFFPAHQRYHPSRSSVPWLPCHTVLNQHDSTTHDRMTEHESSWVCPQMHIMFPKYMEMRLSS